MKKVGFGILGVIGLVFIIGGSVFVGIFPGIMQKKINEELPIVNHTDSYDRWKENPVPITMKFRFFVLNNSDYKSLDDIQLVENGPYVYNETRVKQILNKSDDLITYNENKTYTFQEKQEHNENKEITFLNFPILALLQNKVLPSSSIYPFLEALYLGKNDDETDLFIKRKVKDLLFDGIPYKAFNIPLLKFVGLTITKYRISESKNFLEEPWTINTGEKDIDKIGQITEFDELPLLINNKDSPIRGSLIWPKNNTQHNNCSELKGTDGTFFAPKVSKDDILYAYEPQLCRTVYFTFWKESEVRDIKTYRFRIPHKWFLSPFNNKDNKCYCVSDLNQCKDNGVLDISHCWRRSIGAPIVMSAPYFFNGDDHLRNDSKINPEHQLDDEHYGTYLEVEPMTGMVLKAVRRLQMNVMVKANDKETNKLIKKLGDSKDKTEYLIPVFWIEETGEADEKQADEFKSMVTNKKKLANGISITIIVVGALMAIAAVYLFMRNR